MVMRDAQLPGTALQGRVAIVAGASRGIGRELVLALARAGADVVVAAKSITEKPNLPGTIFSVATEARQFGVRTLPIQVDIRDDANVRAMIARTVAELGRIDILICNSGAIWWRDVADTPIAKFDLVHGVNSRGVFSCVHAALPIMRDQGFGRIIVMSPPVDLRFLKGKVAYCCSKYAQTMLAIGLAQEILGTGISINALWPRYVPSFLRSNF